MPEEIEKFSYLLYTWIPLRERKVFYLLLQLNYDTPCNNKWNLMPTFESFACVKWIRNWNWIWCLLIQTWIVTRLCFIDCCSIEFDGNDDEWERNFWENFVTSILRDTFGSSWTRNFCLGFSRKLSERNSTPLHSTCALHSFQPN